MKFKEVMINILIGEEEEDLLGKMDKKELKELEKMIERIKPTLDALGKKETTDQDIWNFKNLIERNQAKKFVNDLKQIKWLINNDNIDMDFYIEKWKKNL